MKEQNAATDSSATEHTALAQSSEMDASSHLDGMGAVARVDAEEERTPRAYNRNPNRITCSARSVRTGDPCNNPPMHGSTVCRMHGGSAPQVKAAARVRIERAADRVAKELLRMAVDDDVSDSVKLSAINSALDRAGLGSKHAVEVEVGPTPAWKEVFDAAMGGGSRAESRARRGIADDGGAVLDAEVVGLDDDDEAASLLDGAGNGSTAPRANVQAAQPDLDTPSHRQGGSTGNGSGTNPSKAGQQVTGQMAASRVDANYPPIVSLAEAHPDDEPPRRIRTNERNRAITPRMSNGKKRRRE